eukprot:m.98554 g.98554  ORF g.98554 m.98554 type:complete len:208 (-) comp27079_c1_seq1:114-737(-)
MAASIALHAVVIPSLDAVESQDPSCAAAVNSIKNALEKAEERNPGIVHELIDAILESEQSKGGEESIEKLLRVANKDIKAYTFSESTPELKELGTQARLLKSILSRIPDEINDRTKFLSLLREIASCIKSTLESISAVFKLNGSLIQAEHSALELKKKVFVRVSKSFSETLKRYFKDGRKDAVLRSAHRLINQTNSILLTLKKVLEN